MNKANKIDARYSVSQPMQRNWQGYLHSLNKQQFFEIVREGHYLSIFKGRSTRMVQENASIQDAEVNKVIAYFFVWRRDY